MSQNGPCYVPPLLRRPTSTVAARWSVAVVAQYSNLLADTDGEEASGSARGLQLLSDGFAAQCEAVGMIISPSKSESIVLIRKNVECLHQIREKILPQVDEFKDLRILFTSEGRMEQEVNRRIGACLHY